MSNDSKSIGIDEAIKKGVGYFLSMYQGKKVKNVLLEEVRESEDEMNWLITVGYTRPRDYSPDPLGVGQVVGVPWQRDYKVIEVGKTIGEFKSMTIREGLETHG